MSDQPYPPESDLTDYCTGIGRISMAWAFFELHVNLTIWELANVSQQRGACITSHIGSPGARFRALIALVQLRGGTEAHYRALNKLSGTADALGRQRNRFVHDPSFRKPKEDGTPGDFYRFEVTADRTLSFGMQRTDLREMQKLEDEINTLTKKYKETARAILAELPTFSRREFERPPRIDLNLPEAPDTES